ncbi:LPXTG cell wall anchor domain-containing protein [uncultured Ligilactobacillus sp.]
MGNQHSFKAHDLSTSTIKTTELPQTGEKNSIDSILGLLSLMSASVLGIVSSKRKRTH